MKEIEGEGAGEVGEGRETAENKKSVEVEAGKSRDIDPEARGEGEREGGIEEERTR